MDDAKRPARIVIDVEALAEHDGIEPFVAGKCLESNPFPPGKPHDIWACGGLEARARHAG